jgi:hypothetical protein
MRSLPFLLPPTIIFINKINGLLHGAHGGQPNAALAKVHCIIYLQCRNGAARGLYPGSRCVLRRAGELNKGDTMKALVVAVLNALSSAPAADVRSGQQRGNAR